MDKKTSILIGLGGAALIGGIIYYFRAKKRETDIISTLKLDLQNAGIQLPKITPALGNQPVRTPISSPRTPVRTPTSPIRTSPISTPSQQTGNELPPPRFGYGQPTNTYGQPNQSPFGQDFGSGPQGSEYGGGLIFDTGDSGYGGTLLYDTGVTEYGGDTIFDTGGDSEYGGLVLADTGEPCKPSYGTGDWVVSGNQCLGN